MLNTVTVTTRLTLDQIEAIVEVWGEGTRPTDVLHRLVDREYERMRAEGLVKGFPSSVGEAERRVSESAETVRKVDRNTSNAAA